MTVLTDRTFTSRDGLTLAFVEQGEGVPAVFLHGLSASAKVNWLEPGVLDYLSDANLRVIALDFRGHGSSQSPSDPSDCSLESLIDDTVDLIERLDLAPCHLVGYSLGSVVAAHIAARGLVHLDRVVLAGIGTAAIKFESQDPQVVDAVIDALLADDAESLTDPAMKAYRLQVEAWEADPASVAAITRDLQSGHELDPAAIKAPVLVLNGQDDAPTSEIADKIPGASAVTVAGDHLTAPLDPLFAQAIAKFLLDSDEEMDD